MTLLRRLFYTTTLLLSACDSAMEKPVKVVVLGFDGASWETIDPLIESGKLPFLASLKEEAAWAPLTTFKPTKSPVIWTSVATGKSMVKHGILDFVYLEQNDIQVPYSNSEKREPSIWQILDHFGKRSVVINWFVTYPPDDINGVMVSNRFRKTLLLQGERRERMRDSVHPPEYFDALKKHVNLDYEVVRQAKALPDLSKSYRELHPGKSPDDIAVLRDFGIYVLQETLNEEVSLDLYETESFDFFAAYFRLPDIVQHFALELLEPGQVEATLSALKNGSFTEENAAEFREAMAAVLEPFYRNMDRTVEAFMSAPGHENTYFVVLSDHGFALHAGGYDHYHIPESQPAPDGIFLMKGPGTRAGRLPSVTVYDVAPTLLYLYDLPLGENMDGEPLRAALDLERSLARQRYGSELLRTKANRRDSELDRRTLEELRSLGYIQ